MELGQIKFNFDTLSQNLLQIIQQCTKSQTLCQYLTYDVVQPTLQPAIEVPSTLLNNKIYPMAFDEQIEWEDSSYLFVYYFNGDMQNNMVVTDITVLFDVIISKKLWRIQESDGTPAIRPYSIMREIVSQFRNQSIGTVGKLVFKKFGQIGVDKNFNCMRLSARMTGFSGG